MGLFASKENKAEIEELKKKLREKDERISELLTKYAENMQQELTANERTFENVNVPNRPMKIADEYTSFCSDVWLEAKQDIDESKDTESIKEIDKIKLLCNVIIVASEEAARYHDDLWKRLALLLNEPVQGVSALETLAQKSTTTPQKMHNIIGDHYRNAADKIQLQPLIEQVERRVEVATKDKAAKKVLKLKQVTLYIEQASRICWKMVLQRPSMTFEMPAVGKPWKKHSDKYKLEAQYGSDFSHNDAIIHCYVHPILYHDKAIMGRAKVVVGPKGMEFEGE